MSYSGDGTFAAGSATATHSVVAPSATVTYSLPPDGTVTKGQSFWVNVSVLDAAQLAKPSGTVTITIGSASCTATILQSTGAGACTITAAAAGTQNVSVLYSGDATFASKLVTGSFTIAPTASSVAIANITPGSPTVGSTYSVLLTLTSNYGLPPGNIVLAENGETKCSFASSAMVANAYTCGGILATARGSRTLTATFTPLNGDYLADTESRSLSVFGASSTTTITSLSPVSPVVGTSYNVAVQVASAYAALPGGTITLSDGSGGVQGACGAWSPASSATVHTRTCAFTSTTTGGKLITAQFLGNDALNPSSANTGVTIAKGTSTLTIGTLTGPNPAEPSTLLLNRPFTVNVTVSGSGATPTGSVLVSYSAGGSCTATLSGGAGSCAMQSGISGGTLTVSYGGNVNYNGDAKTQGPIVLVKTPTVASIVISALNPTQSTGVARGRQYLVQGRVDPKPGFGTLSISGGSVIIRATSSLGTVSCTAAVTSNTATCYLTAPATLPNPASLALTAEYTGNASFAASLESSPAVAYPVY